MSIKILGYILENSYPQILSPQFLRMWPYLETRSSEELRLNEVLWVDPTLTWLVSFYEEVRTQTQREENRKNRKMAINKPNREAFKEIGQPTPWSQTSTSQKCEEINFCCSRYLGCGTLLWQHSQIHTDACYKDALRELRRFVLVLWLLFIKDT